MAQHHGYSITELENMVPWEREAYVKLVTQWVKEENDRNRAATQKIARQIPKYPGRIPTPHIPHSLHRNL